ncbi:MAG: hypothetical protein JWR00_1463 [Rubritepida sp.]|nr:hypothetical protein [Rubritepida sp.]
MGGMVYLNAPLSIALAAVNRKLYLNDNSVPHITLYPQKAGMLYRLIDLTYITACMHAQVAVPLM